MFREAAILDSPKGGSDHRSLRPVVDRRLKLEVDGVNINPWEWPTWETQARSVMGPTLTVKWRDHTLNEIYHGHTHRVLSC